MSSSFVDALMALNDFAEEINATQDLAIEIITTEELLPRWERAIAKEIGKQSLSGIPPIVKLRNEILVINGLPIKFKVDKFVENKLLGHKMEKPE